MVLYRKQQVNEEKEYLSRRGLRPSLGAWLLLAGVLALIGYWRLFTLFMSYDDEGYVLWSLRQYCAHGGLYTHVYSQYGPFFYAFYHFLHALSGLLFDNDTARLVTLGYWCAASFLCGWCCWQCTHNQTAALATTALTFVALISIVREPSHPGGLLVLVAGLAAAAGAGAITRQRRALFLLMMFVAGTAMALTKINVGALFFIAAITWAAVNSRAAVAARIGTWISGLAAILIPLLLMWTRWPEPWVTNYNLVFTCGALALSLALWENHAPEHGPRSWTVAAGGALALTLVVLGAVWMRGTHWAELWSGIVVGPLRHPTVYAVPVWWPAGARGLALTQLVVAVACLVWRKGEWVPSVIALLRIAAGVAFLACVPALESEPTALQGFCFYYGPSLAWLMAVPLRQTGRETNPLDDSAKSHESGESRCGGPPFERARLWLAWIFIWQTLQAYPVAGSQMGWGAFLFVPVCVTGLYEAYRFWADRLAAGSVLLARGAAALLLCSAGSALWPMGKAGYSQFAANEPLRVPGAEHLRLRKDRTDEFRTITRNAQAHAGVLFSYPGMFSFNIWAQRPSPTDANVTLWFCLLSEEEQRAIMNKLEADPRAMVVVNRSQVQNWMSQGVHPTGDLQAYLLQQFTPAIRTGTYELWAHRGRELASIGALRD
jgi:hypothetical protein